MRTKYPRPGHSLCLEFLENRQVLSGITVGGLSLLPNLTAPVQELPAVASETQVDATAILPSQVGAVGLPPIEVSAVGKADQSLVPTQDQQVSVTVQEGIVGQSDNPLPVDATAIIPSQQGAVGLPPIEVSAVGKADQSLVPTQIQQVSVKVQETIVGQLDNPLPVDPVNVSTLDSSEALNPHSVNTGDISQKIENAPIVSKSEQDATLSGPNGETQVDATVVNLPQDVAVELQPVEISAVGAEDQSLVPTQDQVDSLPVEPVSNLDSSQALNPDSANAGDISQKIENAPIVSKSDKEVSLSGPNTETQVDATVVNAPQDVPVELQPIEVSAVGAGSKSVPTQEQKVTVTVQERIVDRSEKVLPVEPVKVINLERERRNDGLSSQTANQGMNLQGSLNGSSLTRDSLTSSVLGLRTQPGKEQRIESSLFTGNRVNEGVLWAGYEMYPVTGAPGEETSAQKLAEASSEISAGLEEAYVAQGADLLGGVVPLDTTALDRGLQQLLSQINDCGHRLAQLLNGKGLAPWMLAAAVGVAAAEFSHRQMRQRQKPRLGQGADDEACPWPWVLPGMLPSVEI